MNRNTVLCMHSCAAGSTKTLPTLNHQNVRLPPSSDCCLANAKMSLRIALLFPQLMRREPVSSHTTKKRQDMWLREKCWETLSSLANLESWKCYMTPFCIGKTAKPNLYLSYFQFPSQLCSLCSHFQAANIHI